MTNKRAPNISTGGQPLSKRNDKENYTTMSLRIERTFRDKILETAQAKGQSMYDYILGTIKRDMESESISKDITEYKEELKKLNDKLDTISYLIASQKS